MKTTVLIAIVLVFFTSCMSAKKVNSQMDSWLGSTKQELIMQWGPPAKTVSDGSEGEILIYAAQGYVPLSTGQTVNYWMYKMMYVRDGKIYHWLWRKLPNPPENVNVNLFVSYR